LRRIGRNVRNARNRLNMLRVRIDGRRCNASNEHGRIYRYAGRWKANEINIHVFSGVVRLHGFFDIYFFEKRADFITESATLRAHLNNNDKIRREKPSRGKIYSPHRNKYAPLVIVNDDCKFTSSLVLTKKNVLLWDETDLPHSLWMKYSSNRLTLIKLYSYVKI